jgi:hypothetical protein
MDSQYQKFYALSGAIENQINIGNSNTQLLYNRMVDDLIKYNMMLL